MTPDPTSSRWAREFHRLFVSSATAPGELPRGVRTLVLGLSRPAAWQPLGAVWQGVQADLGLPAPAIAVNGRDGLELWFSLAEAVDDARGMALLDRLRLRYLPDVPLHRVSLRATPAPEPLPAPANVEGQWSAFVAADLAPIFEETPWLDLRPGEEGQAELLARIGSITPAALASAEDRLQGRPEAPAPDTVPRVQARASAGHPEAGAFLLQVMRDASAPLALRIEAAKALMPYGQPDR